MAKEQKRRPPVFQAATEDFTPSDTSVTSEVVDSFTDPEGRFPEPEEANDVIQSHIEETSIIVEEGSVEEPAPVPGAQPEAAVPQTDLPFGWKLITEAQHDGRHYHVSAELESEGTQAFWRKTRVLSHFRWVANGKWSDSLTRKDVLPEPRFYKELP